MRSFAFCFALGLSLPSVSQEEKPKPGSHEVFYVRYGRSGKMSLQRQDAQGRELGSIDLRGHGFPSRLRATAEGTLLLSGQGGIVEIDREGKELQKIAPEKGKWEMALDAHPLPNGNILATLIRGQRTFIAELDREGKILREVTPKLEGKMPGIRSASPSGEDRLLIATLTGVTEIDWEGEKQFEYGPDRGGYCYDVHPLPNGNFLYVGSIPGGVKAGIVAEITRDGEKLWSGSHGCPTSVQPLSNGNVLVGGG